MVESSRLFESFLRLWMGGIDRYQEQIVSLASQFLLYLFQARRLLHPRRKSSLHAARNCFRIAA